MEYKEIENNHISISTGKEYIEIIVSEGNLLVYGYDTPNPPDEQEPDLIYDGSA